MIVLTLPGFLISVAGVSLARHLGAPIPYGGIATPTLDGVWFLICVAVISAAFWTFILLGLRAFFVRAYEVLK